MIRETKIFVDNHRNVNPQSVKLANQYESLTNVLKFEFEFTIPEDAHIYIVLEDRCNDSTYYAPLIDGIFVIDNSLTWDAEEFEAHVLITQKEITNGNVAASQRIFVSDSFTLYSDQQDMDLAKLEKQEFPQQIQLVYDKLLNYMKNIPYVEVQKTDGGHYVIFNNIDGKKTFFVSDGGLGNLTDEDEESIVAAVIEKVNPEIELLKKAIPTKISQLDNDKNYLTSIPSELVTEEELNAREFLTDYTETDPTVPSWAKQSSKPTYNANEVGADPKGTAESKMSEHNTSETSHNDIRLLIQGLTNRLNAFLDTDDTTLDQVSELVAYINSNKSLIDLFTTSKVNVTDIVDNLTTSVSNKPLSAKQAVVLKNLIDTLQNSLNDHAADKIVHITSEERASWNSKSNFSGSYNDLKNVPTEFNPMPHTHNGYETEISQLKESIGDLESIPDYVIEEAEATIEKVFSHGNYGRTIRFIAISDTHEDSAESYNPQITISNKHAGQAIKYIADRIGLDFIAHLGDASSCGAWTTTYEPSVLRDDIKNINKFIFSGVRGIKKAFIPGNHDMISMDGYALLNSGAYPLFGNMCSGNKDRLGGWGYFDIEDGQVRVIYLNTSDSPSSASYLALSDEQKNWLCETLIDVNTKDNADEWKVILLSHAPLDFGGADISTDILLPYVNGGSYNDYSFTNNSAKIISNIHGHVHCFSYGYIADKIRRFCIPNACFIGANHYASRTEYADWVDAETYNKTANSGKDTAFSLVTLDLDSGMCYVDNYGAGIDREFDTAYNTGEPVVTRLLDLNRTYVSGTENENLYDYLDESKAYINVAYSNGIFNARSCTASDISEDSVTVKESGIGGVTVAYAIYLPDITTNAYRITFDYSGAGKCRTYYRYGIDGFLGGTNNLFMNETAGASGSADVTIPANTNAYTWLIIMFGSNTGAIKSFTNVELTKVE